MDAIDGNEHIELTRSAPPPSLLTIILDTNPHAWNLLSPVLSLHAAVANIQIFINAHLAINHANRVAVLASHHDRATWLYPTPNAHGKNHPHDSAQSNGSTNEDSDEDEDVTANANKYRPFAVVEAALLANLEGLFDSTTEDSLSEHKTTQIAGALTTALSYTAKQILLASPTATLEVSSGGNSNAVSSVLPDGNSAHAQATGVGEPDTELTSRILIVSVSGDLASQYIPVMNAIFAAQRLRIPIDVLKLAGDTVFLQQACDATGGIYMNPSGDKTNQKSEDVEMTDIGDGNGHANGAPPSHLQGNPQGLLQYLMLAYLPDPFICRMLIPPTTSFVDFRSACFCHRRVIDIGYVCSVCLSIFCDEGMALLAGEGGEGRCLTCGTRLSLVEGLGREPVVVPRRRRKKRREREGGTPGTGTGSAAGTPVPVPGV
ncbi:transcription factor Tfb4 [Aulographum hederae CBS 113979]|uniref:General transcription and DNA repair factor IIH subunit TFB4 n=1 Tax=Aulographum hederae CBS 113979 TaxID=1176131 RepID=A0A6G1H897_9PEZI|nr:transcription factor Tfb4 [Aulographum hederae CBS 113979]